MVGNGCATHIGQEVQRAAAIEVAEVQVGIGQQQRRVEIGRKEATRLQCNFHQDRVGQHGVAILAQVPRIGGHIIFGNEQCAGREHAAGALKLHHPTQHL